MALFIVTNLNDSGAGSLRQALIDANANADADTIQFAANITTGSTSGVDDGTIFLDGTQLVITNDVTINGDVDGDGRADIFIDANSDSRIFNASGAATDVTLHAMTLGYGYGNFYSGAARYGGAIRSSAQSFTMINTYVLSSTAHNGGAFFGNDLTMINSAFRGNYASGDYGGALAVTGTNLAINTTFANNGSAGEGGAAAVGPGDSLTLQNTTLTANSATMGGGGVRLDLYSALTTENTILSGNTAPSDADVVRANGIALMFAENSLLGTGVSLNSGSGNIVTDTPMLDTWADNGGPVDTLALQIGSDAVGTGDATLLPADTFDIDGDGDTTEALPLDANGAARIGGALDIGAVEVTGLQAAVVVDTLVDEADGDFSAGDLSLREALQLVSDGGSITFDAAITGGSAAGVDDGVIVLGADALTIRRDVTINGDTDADGAPDITIDATVPTTAIDHSISTLALESLTIKGALNSQDDGTLLVSDTVLNNVPVASPAALVQLNRGTTAVIENTTIQGVGDTSQVLGLSAGTNTDVTLLNSTVSNFGFGGTAFSGATASIINSTIYDNTQTGQFFKGAGINSRYSDVTVVNATLTGNTQYTGEGGAIYLFGSIMDIRNSTISGNQGAEDGAGIFSEQEIIAPGYIYNVYNSLVVYNSILSGNTLTNPNAGAIPDFGGGVQTSSFVNNVLGTGLTGYSANNVITDMPGLDALADNGGPVPTMALQFAAPPQGAGDTSLLPVDVFDLDGDGDVAEVLPLDANGILRIEGSEGLDIGAVEGVAPPPPPLVVDTLSDIDDGDVSAGNLSLREAIDLVLDGGSITFDAALTGGTTAGVDDGQINLFNGVLEITKSVAIDGDLNDDGVADITLDANNLSRVMTVFSANGIEEVTLDGLTLTGGYDTTFGGGALLSFADKLNIYSSAITDSLSFGKGGGLYAVNATLVNTSILDNTANTYGGGAYLSGAAAQFHNVTIADNTLVGMGSGGGVYSTAGYNKLVNTTVSQNTAVNGSGGGLTFFNPNSNGTRHQLNIDNSTIFDNSADLGGGIVLRGGVDAVVENTILAGNTATTATTGQSDDLSRQVAQGNAPTGLFYSSMIGTNVVVNNLDPNTIGNDTPMLAALADNGGFVQTHALLSGSLAISAGDASLLGPDVFDLDGDGDTAEDLPLDAKGDARVISTLDIGAAEFSAPVLAVTLRDTFGTNVGMFATIAAAVAAASDNFQIIVAPSYTQGPETISTTLSGLAFDMPAGQSVSVGFANETATTLRSTGQGPVTFNGNTANNIFVSGAGADSFVGSTGDDMVSYSTSDARVEVELGLGIADSGHATGDTLNGIEDLFGSAFNDFLRGNGNDNDINGWQGVDNINGLAGHDVLSGESGNDLISGANGDDSIFGGADDDVLRGNGGADSIVGGDGNDTAFGGIGNDFINVGDDNDSVLGQGNNDTILGGTGDDTLNGGSGNDSIMGGDDNDLIFGNGNNDILMGDAGSDTLSGAAGADTLDGGAGADTLTGGLGADRLDGGAGNDLLNGGGQADRLVFGLGGGNDTIAGFEDNIDTIEIDAALAGGMTVAQLLADTSITSVTGASVLLDFGGGDVLRINNIGVADLLDDMLIV